MKRRARERLPVRAAGAFPSYLYKSLDELEGSWGDPEYHSDLIVRAHEVHRKPLILLSDADLDFALKERIGLSWLRALVLIRLRQDPLRPGEYDSPGELLQTALSASPHIWGEHFREIRAIADVIVPTIDGDENYEMLRKVYRAASVSI